MKRFAYILTIFIAFLAFAIGCGGDRGTDVPNGVWSALDTSSHTSCEVLIGGSNAISTGGIYTRVTITHGPGDYDILVGGLTMIENGERGIINFSESIDGSPNRAFITLLGSKRMLLQFDSNSSMGNISYGLVENEYPISMSGIWGGENEVDDNNFSVIAVTYPYETNGNYGVVTVKYSTLGVAMTLKIKELKYLDQNGTTYFVLENNDSDQSTVVYEGTMMYDYERDVMEGVATCVNTGKNYNLQLSPVLTIDALNN